MKNVLDRLEPSTNSPADVTAVPAGSSAATHRHARLLRDRAIVHTVLDTRLRRAEIAVLDLARHMAPERVRRQSGRTALGETRPSGPPSAAGRPAR
ncbi:hypothetical protein ABT362_59505 [Nonomuraea rubra]